MVDPSHPSSIFGRYNGTEQHRISTTICVSGTRLFFHRRCLHYQGNAETDAEQLETIAALFASAMHVLAERGRVAFVLWRLSILA